AHKEAERRYRPDDHQEQDRDVDQQLPAPARLSTRDGLRRARGLGRLGQCNGCHSWLASALVPLLGPDGPAMLARCRLAVVIAGSPPRSFRSSGLTALRCSLAVGSRLSWLTRLRPPSAPRA